MPGNRSCSVGLKVEKDYGDSFLWVLGGISESDSEFDFVYYIIPSSVMAREISKAHRYWLGTPGKKG